MDVAPMEPASRPAMPRGARKIAATLQSAVNIGVLLACAAGLFFEDDKSHRLIFLVGVLPALITLWIRKAVPETEEWEAAQRGGAPPVASYDPPKLPANYGLPDLEAPRTA